MNERLAILISGGGTTMQEIIKACKSGEIPMDVALVISSTPTAGGIEKARKLGIPDHDIVVVDPNDFCGGDGKTEREKLVRPGEEQTLFLAKRIARLMYPHG